MPREWGHRSRLRSTPPPGGEGLQGLGYGRVTKACIENLKLGLSDRHEFVPSPILGLSFIHL